jgi:hypothetical protein
VLATTMQRRLALLVLLLVYPILVASAQAHTSAAIKLGFAPNTAGAPSTITISANFKASDGGIPAPIRKSVTHLPPGLEIELNGLRTCPLAKIELEEPGAGACPAASLLGSGSAFAEVGLGGTPIQEHAPVTAVLGSVSPGRVLIYLDGEGTYPVTEQVIARAVLSGNPATGQTFTITVPPILSVVGGPNVSVVDFDMSLGRQRAQTLLRHRHSHEKLPRGIVLPRSCPHGGLAFPTTLFFQGQGPVHLTPAVPCPRK